MKCNVLVIVYPFCVFYFVLFYSSIPEEISSVSVDVMRRGVPGAGWVEIEGGR